MAECKMFEIILSREVSIGFNISLTDRFIGVIVPYFRFGVCLDDKFGFRFVNDWK